MFRLSFRGPFTLCTIDKYTMVSREPRSGMSMTAVGQFLLGLVYIYIDTLLNIMKYNIMTYIVQGKWTLYTLADQ